MDRVKLAEIASLQKFQSIALDEFVGVVGLRGDIHAGYFETGLMVSKCTPPALQKRSKILYFFFGILSNLRM